MIGERGMDKEWQWRKGGKEGNYSARTNNRLGRSNTHSLCLSTTHRQNRKGRETNPMRAVVWLRGKWLHRKRLFKKTQMLSWAILRASPLTLHCCTRVVTRCGGAIFHSRSNNSTGVLQNTCWCRVREWLRRRCGCSRR